MYFDEFILRLKKDDWPSTILLFGDSESVISEGYRFLKEEFKRKKKQGDIQVFESGEPGLTSLLASAQTTSFFSTVQLLILRNAEKNLGGRSEVAAAQLLEYFDNPNPDSTLVFLANGLRKNAKIVNLLEKKGWAVQCSDMPEWKMTAWIRQQAKQIGLDLNEEGCQVLIQKAGLDVAYLQRALEHLSIYLYPQKTATISEIRALPIPGAEAEVYPFLDAVSLRQSEKALGYFNNMASGSENGVIFLLYQRVRELLSIAVGREEGLNQSDLAQRLGLHPFRIKNLWEQAQKFSVEELKLSLKDLIHIQAGLVTGRLGKNTLRSLLEWWILKWGKNPLAAYAAPGR
jgi:DNA polymerase-3 subunit delta